MAKRGRKSTGDLGMVTNIPQRPDPLAHLNEAEQEVWRVVVQRMPVDWFPPETWDLLAAYCNHVVAQREIKAMSPDDEGDLMVMNRWRQMLKRESEAMTSLGTKLRITNQTRIEAKSGQRQRQNQYQDVSEDY